jgi:hypothetical protein
MEQRLHVKIANIHQSAFLRPEHIKDFAAIFILRRKVAPPPEKIQIHIVGQAVGVEVDAFAIDGDGFAVHFTACFLFFQKGFEHLFEVGFLDVDYSGDFLYVNGAGGLVGEAEEGGTFFDELLAQGLVSSVTVYFLIA